MRFRQGVDPDVVRSEAERILSDPKYRRREPGLIERAVVWVFERIGDLLGRLASTGSEGGFGIGYVVLALLAVGIVYLVWRFRPVGLRSAKAEKVSAEIERRERTGRDVWLERAAEAAAQERWAEVVLARYRATHAGLVDAGDVPETEGLTALESLAAFEATGRRRQAFDDETRRFRAVRYGGDPAMPTDDETLRRLDETTLDRRGEQR